MLTVAVFNENQSEEIASYVKSKQDKENNQDKKEIVLIYETGID